MIRDGVYLFDSAVLIYFLFINSFYALLLVISFLEIYRRYAEVKTENFEHVLKSESVPGITIIAPAYNESANIQESILSILKLSYPKLDLIIVNDGSIDNTLAVLQESFQLKSIPPAFPSHIKTEKIRGVYRSKRYRNLIVIDKNNGGKADSLNAAINACGTPYFMAIDADTIIEKDALQRMIRPTLTQHNVIASCGTIRVANNCVVESGFLKKVRFPSNLLAMVQTVEYLRAFLFGRLGWNRLGGNLVISGAFGLFNRQAVTDIGGYRTDTVGEDMELTVHLHRHMLENNIPYKIEFIPDPVVWTEVPESLSVLHRQRERWHRGLLETLLTHRQVLWNPKYKWMGMVSFPFFVFGELLAPLIELLGYIGLILGLYLGAIDSDFALLFFLLSWGFSALLTLFAIFLEITSFRRYDKISDFFKMIYCLLIETFGYRQLTILFRLQGFYKYLRGDQSWGNMTRTGFSSKERAK
jgi:cellulose synthase/poly-beta-1,6-N-acetylglucosamine synthase-like glycosyltransferase